MVRVSALVALILAAAPAAAADLAVSIESRAVVAPGLWRGHFSGGINYNPRAQDIALAWTDQVAYFPDHGSCWRWIRGLRAQVQPYQGFTGCLRIR